MNNSIMNKVYIEVLSIYNMKKVNSLERYDLITLSKAFFQGLAAYVSKCVNRKTGEKCAVKIMRTDDEEKLMAAQQEYAL